MYCGKQVYGARGIADIALRDILKKTREFCEFWVSHGGKYKDYIIF
jgi:hypothetical protein